MVCVCGLCSTGTARGGVQHVGSNQKGRQRGAVSFAVRRIEVEISGQNKWPAWPVIQHVFPKAQLIPIAQAIAILRPVENGRGRRVDHKGQGAGRCLQRYLPMPGGGKPLNGNRFLGREGGTVHPWQHGARQIGPQKRAVIDDLTIADRHATEEGQPTVAIEPPVALGIPRLPGAASSVQVQTGGEARVAWQRTKMLERAFQTRVEGGEGDKTGVMVELCQQQHVGPDPVDDREDGRDLGVLTLLDVAKKKARTIPAERRAKGRDPKGLCQPCGWQPERDKRKDQAVAAASSACSSR